MEPSFREFSPRAEDNPFGGPGVVRKGKDAEPQNRWYTGEVAFDWYKKKGGKEFHSFQSFESAAEAAFDIMVGFVIVFSDSDRVGRGEWSRVYDACMVVRVYLSGLRAPCMPRRCLRRLETRHPYHLGGVFWYGSSISIIIYLSLIRGISSVADGKNMNLTKIGTTAVLLDLSTYRGTYRSLATCSYSCR